MQLESAGSTPTGKAGLIFQLSLSGNNRNSMNATKKGKQNITL